MYIITVCLLNIYFKRNLSPTIFLIKFNYFTVWILKFYINAILAINYNILYTTQFRIYFGFLFEIFILLKVLNFQLLELIE